MRKFLKFLGYALAALVGLVVIAIAGIVAFFPRSHPAPTETIERTPARLERGRYLAEHVLACVDCHSEHSWDRFGEPLKPETLAAGGHCFGHDYGVPGTSCPPNISSDAKMGVGAWTDGELLRAVREGVAKDGHALFPHMPYDSFASLSDEDARSVVVYLRSLPPKSTPSQGVKLDFPLNLAVRLFPHPLGGPVASPDPAKSAEYGKYLVATAGCRHCHTPENSGEGQPMDLAGGGDVSGPWGTVLSANITPDPDTGIGKLSREAFIGRFKAFAGPLPDAPDSKSTAGMPWIVYAGMTEPDLGAIYDYLQTVKPAKNAVTPVK